MTPAGPALIWSPFADPESADAMARAAVAEFGGIDYLVNNAAIFGGMKLEHRASYSGSQI